MKNEREGKKTPPEKDSESTDADGHKKVDEQLEHAYAFYFAYGERLTAMIHYQYLLKRPGPEIFHALADSIGIGTLSGFQMYVTRDGIPFVKSVPNDKTKIRGEVFAITRENYRVLAALRKGGAVLGFPSLQNFDLEVCYFKKEPYWYTNFF